MIFIINQGVSLYILLVSATVNLVTVNCCSLDYSLNVFEMYNTNFKRQVCKKLKFYTFKLL